MLSDEQAWPDNVQDLQLSIGMARKTNVATGRVRAAAPQQTEWFEYDVGDAIAVRRFFAPYSAIPVGHRGSRFADAADLAMNRPNRPRFGR
ncbi:MAG: hypothetical protein O3A51_14015 [Verrucomicrobia bacterium]|nr:hypothetical protein [Verrucomicrobiota bacterium]